MQSATKDHLWYRRFHNKEEVEIAVHEWLEVQKSDFYCEGLFKVYQGRQQKLNTGIFIEVGLR